MMTDADQELVKTLADMSDINEFETRKVLKNLSILMSIYCIIKDQELYIPYVGTFQKKNPKWAFKESDYLCKLRTKSLTEKDIINLFLSEDD